MLWIPDALGGATPGASATVGGVDRLAALERWHTEKLMAMRAEIEKLLASPAKYLDAALTAEPATGRELYPRYDEIRGKLPSDFQEWVGRFPTGSYETDRIGSLQRKDLASLSRDIDSILRVLTEP